MPSVYPTPFLVLTGLSILLSFTNACLSTFNISYFILFINAAIAGITFLYHITLLILAYRRSLRSYVVPRLFVAWQWTNLIVVALLGALWTVSFVLAMELVVSDPQATLRRTNRRPGVSWNIGTQAALAALSGIQIIGVVAFIWIGVTERRRFTRARDNRTNEKLQVYLPPKLPSIEFGDGVPEKEPPSPASFIQHKFSSLPRLAIPTPTTALVAPAPTTLPQGAPRAKVKHSAMPEWHFVTPEVRPSPLSTIAGGSWN